MDGLSQRLKQLREAFSMSQRRFSTELGLSPDAWRSYESGSSLPGAGVLQALFQRGIDLNWLMSGEGSLWRDTPATPRTISGLMVQSGQVQADLLGLGKLSLLAKHSNRRHWDGLLSALARNYPNGTSLQALIDQTGLSQDDASIALLKLLEVRAIERLEVGGVEVFVATRPGLTVQLPDSSDIAQLTVNAVRWLVQEAFPTVVESPTQAVIAKAEVTIKPGAVPEFIAAAVNAIKDLSLSQHVPDGETVQFLWAASQKGRGAERAEQ